MRNVKKQTYQVLNLSLPKPSWENALQMLRFSSDVKLHGTNFFFWRARSGLLNSEHSMH